MDLIICVPNPSNHLRTVFIIYYSQTCAFICYHSRTAVVTLHLTQSIENLPLQSFLFGTAMIRGESLLPFTWQVSVV